MRDVQEFIVVGRTRRNSRKPSWLTTNMIVAYALLVIEKAIPLHIGKLKPVHSPRSKKIPWWKRWVLCTRTTLGNYQSCPRKRRWSIV